MAIDDEDQHEQDALVEDFGVLKEGILEDTVFSDELTRDQAWCLYLSHFLSMWNSRTYEYGAVLFAQHTWPGGFLPSSIIGISETICVLLSSTAIGRWIDSSPSRLRPLVFSIVANRVTLVINCVLWLLIFATNREWLQKTSFGLVLVLGMVEKTSRMANMLSFERDWIPTVASYPTNSGLCGAYNLTHLNTVVRRIDITCKFLAPIAASASMSIFSVATVTTMIAGVSLVSVCVELLTILRVWRLNRRLKAPKLHLKAPETTALASYQDSHSNALQRVFNDIFRGVSWLIGVVNSQAKGFDYYFSTDVWIPSMGVAILHTSVLAWAGTLITYLLNAGFTYGEVTIAKAIGSVFEIGSTFVFPWAVSIFATSLTSSDQQRSYKLVSRVTETEECAQASLHSDVSSDTDETLVAEQLVQDPSTLRPIVATGKWGIIGLCISLVPTVIALFALDASISLPVFNNGQRFGQEQRPPSSPRSDAFAKAPLLSVVFFAFLSLSFLGRWTYDLSVTQLTQTLVPDSRRSEFGGTEMAVVASVSFLHWLAAAVWHAQPDFKWLATGSLCAVTVATIAYVAWTRRMWGRHSNYFPLGMAEE